jgi:hypothetical protein
VRTKAAPSPVLWRRQPSCRWRTAEADRSACRRRPKRASGCQRPQCAASPGRELFASFLLALRRRLAGRWVWEGRLHLPVSEADDPVVAKPVADEVHRTDGRVLLHVPRTRTSRVKRSAGAAGQPIRIASQRQRQRQQLAQAAKRGSKRLKGVEKRHVQLPACTQAETEDEQDPSIQLGIAMRSHVRTQICA